MTPQEQLRHTIQQALEAASGKITMVQGLEELTAALAMFTVAEGLGREVVKRGFDLKCDQFADLMLLGSTPAEA